MRTREDFSWNSFALGLILAIALMLIIGQIVS